jgi:hypothetical protein
VSWPPTRHSLFEVHNKNWIIMFGFFASIVVWFGWNLVIARIYKAEWDEYAVYGSIYDAFGSQLFWWAAVGLVLGTLVSIELMAQSLRRVLLPTDVDHFGRRDIARRRRRRRRRRPNIVRARASFWASHSIALGVQRDFWVSPVCAAAAPGPPTSPHIARASSQH